MISQVLQEIMKSKEPVSLAALSQKLNIERGALEGMLAYWVRKNRLQEDGQESVISASTCVSCGCGSSCIGAANCPFVAKMPKIYTYSASEWLAKTPKKTEITDP